MNIGFEAKRAFTNGTGLGHYSRTLVTSLAEYYPDHEYFLFTPRTTDRFRPQVHNLHVVTPHRFPDTLFTAAWRSSRVKKDLLECNIDIYHGLSHEIPAGIGKTGIGTVVTMHDLIFERYPGQFNPIDVRIYRQKFTYACKHADLVIAISRQTRDDLMQLYRVPENKIRVCYQSCHESFAHTVPEAEKERVKRRYRLPERFLLYVGSVIERKNLLTICKALKQLGPDLPWPLVVIGDGRSYKKKVQAYVASNGLQNRVIFLSDKDYAQAEPGFRNAVDFPAIYQMAEMMIYPSIFEGFGIPVLEALWSGLPVITSNVSCLPETGGDAALYVDPYDDVELARAIERVATDAGLRAGMISRGLTHARRFSRAAAAEAVMKVYKEIENAR